MNWAPAALGAAVAFAVGALATALVAMLARRMGLVAKPNPIVPQHTRPVAHLGGLGLALGLGAGAAAVWLTGGASGIQAGLWGSAAAFVVVGAIDDVVAFGAAAKFGLQLLVAIGAVALGVWAPLTGVQLLDQGLAAFWILMLVNAFNFVDVCDGLLATVTFVAMSTLAIAAPVTVPVALPAAGACAGFLVFNRPPASIFMGDAGSHLLGFLSAALTLAVAREIPPPALAMGAGALLVGVPLFELVFLTAVRLHKGLPWWKGSPDHFALRLQAAGLTRAQTDLVAAGAGALCGAGAIALIHVEHVATPFVVAVSACAAAAIAAVLLLRWEVQPRAAAASGPGPQAAPASSAHYP
ncbi:MAG: MraY family glycosyltransferase [Phycisphaerales bacterium JB039]